MEHQSRTILLSVVAGTLGALGFLMLLGFWISPRRPASSPQATASTTQAAKPLAGVTVVLDPGHGGLDPGTTAGPLSEAALTYRTADELAACLQAQGATVVYTVHSRLLNPILAAAEPPVERPTDAVMAATGEPLGLRHSPRPLWQRAATAQAIWTRQLRRDPQAAQDVFFLSLHFDQFPAAEIHGGVVCVDRRSRVIPALAKALAGQMVSGNFGRTGDFHGVQDIAGRELGVLNPAYNPVPEKVLLEIATLSNPENAQEAGDSAWRGELVRRIAQAITQTHQRSPSLLL